jgi:glycosyltransferase involved in cell wall biosynthesis
MRVCLLARYFGLRNGGIGRYASSLRDGLLGRGVDVYGVSEDMWVDFFPDSLIHYFSYSLMGIPILMPRACDIYHATQVIESLYLPYGRRATVVTVHDLIPLFYAGSLVKTHYASNVFEWLLTKTWFSHTLRRALGADRIVAVSDDVASQLVSSLDVDPERVLVIPNGIPDELSPMPKPDDTPRVGFLGYLDPRKRVDILIEAYKASSHGGELWIAGDTRDERYRSYLMDLARDDGRIRFLGFWPDDRLVDFYRSIDIFVFPSRIEGYGLPILEALACGRPVVTLDDGLIPWDIKSHTYIVSRDDLTGVIESGLDVDTRSVDWAGGRRWSFVVERILDLYDSLL